MTDRLLELKVLFTAVDKFVRPVKAITDASRAASKALKESTDRASQLNGTIGKIDAFQRVQRDAANAADSIKATEAKIAALRGEMDKVGVPTKAMARELGKLSEKSSELTERTRKLKNDEVDLRAALKMAGVDTTALARDREHLVTASAAAAMASRKLAAALEVENQKMNKLHAARAQMDKANALRRQLAGTGTALAAAGAGVTAAVAVPVIAYAKAEESATELKSALMQAGGKISEQFHEINAQAERLGNKLPGTTSDYQDMMTTLIRQGMPAKSLLGGLGDATAYLAVQLKMAPTAAAEFASKLQDATRATDREMMGLMDTIQRTYNLGVKQDAMLAGFAKLSPALSVLKRSGLDAANALAPLLVMTDQAGMAGEAAGNAFRKIFQMSLDAKKLAKGNAALSGTGIKLDFSNGQGEFGGMDKMFDQLNKLKGVNTQQRLGALKTIFGDDAETLQALTVMIEKGAGGYQEVQAKMAAQASLQERVNLQLKTLTKLWDAATGTFNNALVTLGESVAPELHAAAEWLGTLAERTQAWAKENPNLAAGLMTVAKWAAVILVGLGGLALAASAVLFPFAAMNFGLAAIGVSSGAAFTGLMGLLLPLAKVAAAFAAGYAIGTLFNAGINAGLSAILGYETTLGASLFDLVEGIKAKFGDLVDWFMALPKRLSEAGAAMIDGLVEGITSKWESIKKIASELAMMLPEWIRKPLDMHSPSRVFAQLGGYTMQGFENGLIDGQSGPVDAVSAMAKKLAAIGAGVTLGGAAMANDIPLDTRPPLSIASQSGSASMTGNHFSFNVYAAPGMDERTLAQAVRSEFEKVERERAAQYRSRLRDPE